jgi:hypothetical protein
MNIDILMEVDPVSILVVVQLFYRKNGSIRFKTTFEMQKRI